MNIFVAGTYGVGKTFICDKLSFSLSLPHFSASQIIRHGSEQKTVDDLKSNQQRLINGLASLNNNYPTILLDGHFSILTEVGISVIETSVFKSLSLKGIVLLVQEPDVIKERLEMRGGEVFDLHLIESFQEVESSQAEIVSRCLNIPLLKMRSVESNLVPIADFINSL